MALLKKAVFIASRFAEFAELREAIKRRITDITVVHLSAIDLNDANVSHRAPLQECLGYVRRSEFLILLLGDGYGEPAPGHKKSITHLEYEEAIKEGSNTRVLVFCIGNSYRGRRISYAADNEQLALLQRQVHDNHTLGFLEPETPVDIMAKEIVDRLLNALYEMSFGVLAQEADDEFGADVAIESDDPFASEAEISALEYKGAQARGTALADDAAVFSDALSALRAPAAVQAQEQREEARRALDVGQLAVAVQHLRRALEFRPLDVLSNYWLAQIFVAMGNKKKAAQAVEHAERAARIAEYEDNPVRAAASHVTAARAFNVLEKHEEALRYAKRALDIDDSKAIFHVELARQQAISGNATEMREELRSAFRLYPRSLQGVLADVAFQPFRQDIQEFVRQQREELQRRLAELIDSEAKLATLAGVDGPGPLDAKARIGQLIGRCKRSAQRQVQLVQRLFKEAEQLSIDLETQPAAVIPETEVNFPFTRSGDLIIERWYVDEEAVIEPGDKILEYRFNGQSQSRIWEHRGPGSVRMWWQAGDRISRDDPCMYTTVPVSWVPPRVSHRKTLANKVAELNKQFADAENAKRGAQSEIQKLKALSSTFTFQWKLVSALVCLVGVCVFAYFKWTELAGICLMGVVALGFTGWKGRASHRTAVEALSGRVGDAERIREQLKSDANDVLQEITAFEQNREKAIESARSSIEVLESTFSSAPSMCLPFKSIFAADVGDVVRVRQSQLSQFKAQSRRDVVVKEDLPSWLGPGRMATENNGLYCIVERADRRIVLSRRQAFVRADADRPKQTAHG